MDTNYNQIVSFVKVGINIKTTEALRQIREYLTVVETSAINVLDNIEMNCIPVCEGITLTDIITSVWNKINNTSINQSLLLSRFVQELEDCIEDGEIVCTFGKIQRLMNIFTGIETDNQIITDSIFNNSQTNIDPQQSSETLKSGPLTTLKSEPQQSSTPGLSDSQLEKKLNVEMMNKASKIHKNIYDGLSSRARKLIDEFSGSTGSIPFEAQMFIDLLNFKVKRSIRETFYNDYVTLGILTKDKLNEILEKWINSI